MELNVVGKGKQVKDQNLAFERNDVQGSKRVSSIVGIRDKIDRSRNFRRETNVMNNVMSSGRANRKYTYDNLSSICNSPLRLPEKPAETSFSNAKPFLSPSPQNEYPEEIHQKIERRLQEYGKSRMSEIRIKKLYSSKKYSEKVSEWTESRRLRKEELTRKLEWMKRPAEISPGERQIFYDDDDFNYSFKTREGKCRKSYEKIIDVSARPSYFAPNGFISIQPHIVYNTSKVEQQKSFYFDTLGESFKVKSALAAKNIKFESHKIHPSVIDLVSTDLPKGGENLLRC